MLKAENITKTFIKTNGKKKEEFNAVDGISLEANQGEIIGILGPNGAGKTTLLRILGHLMDCNSGHVSYYDKDGKEIVSDTEIKRNIGYVSNNTGLYEKMTPKELFGYFSAIYQIPSDILPKREDILLKKLKLDEFYDSRQVGKLSTGQKQRVSIARCLLIDPPIYILDEPTLGLDIISAAEIIKFMDEERKNGKTVLYSTHYLEEAEKLCDRIIFINNGKVIESGPVKDVIAKYNAKSLREAFVMIMEEGEKE